MGRRNKLALKKLCSSKFRAVVLFLTAVIIFSYYASALLTSRFVISNRGQVGNDIYAASGSTSDIQAVVNLISSSGGTVHIPAGTFYWNGETVTIPGGVNVIGASPAGCKGHEGNWENYTATTILHNNHGQISGDQPPEMFTIDGSNGKATRISGIQFEATGPTTTTNEEQGGSVAIYSWYAKNLRIDHNTFINFANTAVSLDSSSGWASGYSSYGVLDHNLVDNPYKLSGSGWVWGYGFYSRGNMKPDHGANGNWNNDITDFAGVYGNVDATTIMYVEDSKFLRTRHATDAIQGSWNVVRFSLFEYAYPCWGDIDLHGSQTWYSGRGMEVYNNTIIGTTNYGGISPQNLGGVRLRGGSALVFNNNVTYTQNSLYQTLMVLDDFDYSVTYAITNIHQTYIWDNTVTNGSALRVSQGTENTDYSLRAPNQAQDGFTYTPYPYPHPLATQP